MAKTGTGRNNKSSNQGRNGSSHKKDSAIVSREALHPGAGGGKGKKSYEHVVVRGDGWAVRNSSTGRFTRVFETKRDAIDVGRKLVRSEGGELLIHGRSGQIFQRSQAPSTISEATIRKAIRTSSKKSAIKKSTKRPVAKKSAGKPTKKSIAKKSASKSGVKKK
jgi:hypothetical protein